MKRDLEKSFRLPKRHNFVGLLFKNYILIRRNLAFLIFQFLIPVLQISLFCMCIGREPYDLKLGIVNNETIFETTNKYNVTNLSTIYISQLSERTFIKRYSNWADAYAETRRGEIWAFLDFSQNFSQDTIAKFENPLANSTWEASNVNLYQDASNQQISLTIQAKATLAYQSFMEVFLDMLPSILPFSFKINKALLQLPIKIQDPIYGDRDPKFLDFMAPGIMITIIFTIAIGLTALMFVIEKKEGILDRSWVADVSIIELMSAHVLLKLIIMTVQAIVLIAISSLVFNVNLKGPIIISAFLLLLQGFCGMSYGLALSAICENEMQVLEVAIGSVFPVLLLSGIIWPVEGMPSWVRIITNISPLTHTAEAMRCVASRGWNFLYTPVWSGALIVTAWSIVFNLIAMILFNFSL